MDSANNVHESEAEIKEAVAYKKNPYKVASLPNFLKVFKRKSADKSAPQQPTANP